FEQKMINFYPLVSTKTLRLFWRAPRMTMEWDMERSAGGGRIEYQKSVTGCLVSRDNGRERSYGCVMSAVHVASTGLAGVNLHTWTGRGSVTHWNAFVANLEMQGSGTFYHTPEEIGIDAFQAMRSPDERYRTAPLKGLWTHAKGGFYHDGRFAAVSVSSRRAVAADNARWRTPRAAAPLRPSSTAGRE
ncbi:MAG: hypothetical protein ACREXP_29555, partial [Steroidobacteraceae bacterium]